MSEKEPTQSLSEIAPEFCEKNPFQEQDPQEPSTDTESRPKPASERKYRVVVAYECERNGKPVVQLIAGPILASALQAQKFPINCVCGCGEVIILKPDLPDKPLIHMPR